MGKKEERPHHDNTPAWRKAIAKIEDDPLFRLAYCTRVYCSERYPMAKTDWAYITNDGSIYLNPHRKAAVAEWEYIISHGLLHLGFGHFQKERMKDARWNIACDLVVARFLKDSRYTTAGISAGAAFSGQRGRAGIPAITDCIGFWKHF